MASHKASGKGRVLVVDDKLEMAQMLAEGLSEQGYQAQSVGSGAEALALLPRESFDALVTDLRMPGVDGLELLRFSKQSAPDRPVIVMTAFGAMDSAIESIRQGAYHYLTKPFRHDELTLFLERALEEVRVRREATALKVALREQRAPLAFISRSPAMQAVLDALERVAPTRAPVLLRGETGTGKGFLAKALHLSGGRAAGPFITVNCAALPAPLLESELFGHVRGAFTGAVENRAGLFAEAHGGTLFLDEIGELPLALQAKLLHVLEDGHVRAVGASREQTIDVRLVAATHRNLRQEIKAGTFREDLLYRIEVVPLVIPPLRERQEDLPGLLEQFFQEALRKHSTASVQRISPESMRQLLAYRWPGNVRELAHVMERLVLLSRGKEVSAQDLELASLEKRPELEAFDGGAGSNAEVVSIREVQRRYARWALERLGGHRGRTAQQLDVDPKTLAKWLEDIET
jgi:two-component system response regulator HydG